jgi:hypothetical protein
MTVDVQCVRFINGLANSTLKNHAKSHRAQKGYQITLVELQNFLNDVVTDSPELGNTRSTVGPSALHASAILRTLSRKPLISGSVIRVAVVLAAAADADADVVEATMVDVVKHLVAMILTRLQMR